MVVGGKSFSTLLVAAALFGLAGSVVAVALPGLFVTGAPQPSFIVFLVAGVAMISLTAGLFAFVGRLGMGFGRTALVLAAGYNALIGAVKLGFAPAALYEANRAQSFDTNAGDPNTLAFYLVVGAVVLTLYVAVFSVIFRVFRQRFKRRAESQAVAAPYWARATDASSGDGGDDIEAQDKSVDFPPDAPPGRHRGFVLAGVVVAGIVALGVGSAMWWVPVFLVGLPVLSYLSYIFTTFGAIILLALGMAAVLAWMTFDRIERRAAGLGDATLLASFFWFGMALILAYHVMWAVFLLALVSIWPFQTYTPK